MSQKQKSSVIEKMCEGCGVTKTYEMVGIYERPVDLKDITNWITHIREVFVPGEGFIKIMTQSCSIECAPAAALKLLAVAVPEEPVDSIDLAALRTSQFSN